MKKLFAAMLCASLGVFAVGCDAGKPSSGTTNKTSPTGTTAKTEKQPGDAKAGEGKMGEGKMGETKKETKVEGEKKTETTEVKKDGEKK